MPNESGMEYGGHFDGEPASKSEAAACSAADELEMPPDIKSLIAKCEVNWKRFNNREMSTALHFAEMLWRRLSRMAEHYERQSGNFMDGDIRGPMIAQAAKDMQHVLRDCTNDCR